MRASIFRLTPLFLLAAALMAASVLLVHDAPPAAADHGAFWSATLTVPTGSGTKGCLGAGTATPHECGMALTEHELYIPLEPNTHQVTALQVFANGALQFSLNNPITSLSQRPLTLTIDGKRFHFEDGRFVGAGQALTWDNSGLSWSTGDTVEVSLEQRQPPTCDGSPGGADSALNPTDLRIFGGKRVLTLAWLNPDVDQGIAYMVRWRKTGTTAWLNPHGPTGEWHNSSPRYTHDITGLEDGTGYEAQVRIVLVTTSSAHNAGQAQPGRCSEWVSGTRATRLPAGTEPAPDNINMTTSGPLREGGPSVNVFFRLLTGEFEVEAPARAAGGATLGADIPVDDPPGDSLLTRYYVRWVPDIAQGATVAVMQMYVPEDDVDNNCRTHEYSVTFPPQVAGGKYLSKDFSFTIVDNDGTADTCTGAITEGSGAGGV